MDLYIDPFNTGGHSLSKQFKEKIRISCEPLDAIIKTFDIKKVDLIKIDVEGFEKHVLLGGLRTLKKHHPNILIEAWNEEKLKNILDILLPLNYKYKKISHIDYYFF